MSETKPNSSTGRRLVRRAFDKAAASYEDAAVLEGEVLDRHLQRLDIVRIDPARILDAGCGNGRAIGELLARYPGSDVVAVDLSERMLGSLPAGNTMPLCADIGELPLAADSIDIVFSNLALPWVSDLDAAFAEFRRVLKPRGLLTFTSFGPDTLRELRSAWAAADPDTHVNAFFDMHDIGDALIRNGLAEPVMDIEMFTLSYENVGKLMSDLRETGARNLSKGRPRGLTGKGKLDAMTSAYETLRRDDRLPATYEVIYGHAWAPSVKTTRNQDEFRFPASGIGLRGR